MASKTRYLLFSLFAAALLLLALGFRETLLDHLVLPLATVVWLFLRIFVLSIDQEIYWWALIFLAVLSVLSRLRPASRSGTPAVLPDANPQLERVRHWQNTIRSSIHGTEKRSDIQKDLGELLVTVYSTGQQAATQAEIKEALLAGQIPLSDPVYSFLFAREASAPRPGFVKHPVGWSKYVLQSARSALQRQRSRWTGQEAAEYYQTVDDALTLIETSMEVKDDYGSRNVDHN